MSIRKTIDFKTLDKLNACFSQRFLFQDFAGVEWGVNKRVAITPENVLKAADEGLDIDWLITTVLNPDDFQRYLNEVQTTKRKYNGRTKNPLCRKAIAKITAKYLTTKWNPRTEQF